MRRILDFYLHIDERSLGLFRIALAVVLVGDWLLRWPSLEAFYTDFGLLPIASGLARAGAGGHFSLLDGFTSLPMVRLFFLGGLVCYLLLLVGYRVRLFTLLSWLFLLSVVSRNVMIRHGGDVLMVTMLTWSLFLPLGARFSVDALRAALRLPDTLGAFTDPSRTPEPARWRSLAALAIILQIAIIYLLTAYAKQGPTWRDGTAIYYALQHDQFVRPIGVWLLMAPMIVLKLATWATLAVEYAAAPLILCPFLQPWLRRIAIALLVVLHLGTALTLNLGPFPFAMISTFALLLTARDWEALASLSRRWSRRVTVYYDDTCGICSRSVAVLAVADRGRRMRFVGTSDPARIEHNITPAEAQTTVIVVDEKRRRMYTRAAAARAISRALPLPMRPLGLVGLPGLSAVGDVVYDAVAANRHRISAFLGLAACGLPPDPRAAVASEPQPAPVTLLLRRMVRWAREAIVALLLLVVLVESYNHNVAPLHGRAPVEPFFVRAVSWPLQLVHDWNLFAPDPPMADGWWVIEGVTERGVRFDPLTGLMPTFDKPLWLSSKYDVFWRKYMDRMTDPRHTSHRLWFGKYITRRNHREMPAGQRLEKFTIYFVRERTPAPHSDHRRRSFDVEIVPLWEHRCFGDAQRK